ncbi:MAG: hypothetical protein JO257_11210 [Deltaproteobacteria bacterium]|nr:hypothetical protein [Deltaproteobacteria bacterium]
MDNRSDQRSHPSSGVGVGASVRADALRALTTLGFTKTEARRAVERALDDNPPDLEQLLRGALRHTASRSRPDD